MTLHGGVRDDAAGHRAPARASGAALPSVSCDLESGPWRARRTLMSDTGGPAAPSSRSPRFLHGALVRRCPGTAPAHCSQVRRFPGDSDPFVFPHEPSRWRVRSRWRETCWRGNGDRGDVRGLLRGDLKASTQREGHGQGKLLSSPHSLPGGVPRGLAASVQPGLRTAFRGEGQWPRPGWPARTPPLGLVRHLWSPRGWPWRNVPAAATPGPPRAPPGGVRCETFLCPFLGL